MGGWKQVLFSGDKYTDAEAVAAVATADDYVKNDADDEMAGRLEIDEIIIKNGRKLPQIQYWESTEFINIGGTGTWAQKINESVLSSGAVNGNRKYIYYGDYWVTPGTNDRHIRFSASVMSKDTCANKETWVVLLSGVTPSVTAYHLGFRIVNGDIYASNGNGVNGTQTDTGIKATQWANITFVAVYGTDNIKYYINGILKATHTTNRPAGITLNMHHSVKTTENVLKENSIFPGVIYWGEIT